MLRLSLDETSAKVRTGGPVDDEEDYELPVWAGTVPIQMVAGAPQGDARLPTDIGLPGYLTRRLVT